MNPLSIFLLGMAMSTDAFAAALGKGVAMTRPRLWDALRIGFLFGVIEAITPVIGWLLGSAASRLIEDWDHWLAFVLLAGLGMHMIYKALVDSGDEREELCLEGRRNVLTLAATGLATSLDAMAVGIGLAFADVSIFVVAVVIGMCTFAMVTFGIMAGSVLGSTIGKRAELLGGLVLIAVGASILYEHTLAAA